MTPTLRCPAAPGSRWCSSFGPDAGSDGGQASTSPRPRSALPPRGEIPWRSWAERAMSVAGPQRAGGRGVRARRARRGGAGPRSLSVDAAGSGVRIGEDGIAISPEEGRTLIESIRSSQPRVVLVAFGAPKQERWIHRYAADVPSARIMMGVGGTFDMWAGRFPRAPSVMHRLGLEWLWRLAQQPS